MAEYFYRSKNMTIDNGFVYNTHRTYNEDYFDKLPNVKKQITINTSVVNYYETFYQPANTFISGIFLITSTGTFRSTNCGLAISTIFTPAPSGSAPPTPPGNAAKNIFTGSVTNLNSSAAFIANSIYNVPGDGSIDKQSYTNTYRPIFLHLQFDSGGASSSNNSTNGGTSSGEAILNIYIEYKNINTGNIINNDNYYILVKNTISEILAADSGVNPIFHGNADSFLSYKTKTNGFSRINYSGGTGSSTGNVSEDAAIDLVTGQLSNDEIVVLPNYYGINGDLASYTNSTLRLNKTHHELEWECAIGFPKHTTTILASSASATATSDVNKQLQHMGFFIGLRTKLQFDSASGGVFGDYPKNNTDLAAYFAFSTNTDAYKANTTNGNFGTASQLNFIYKNDTSNSSIYKTDLKSTASLDILEDFVYFFKIIITNENRVKIFIGKTNNVTDSSASGYSVASTHIDYKQYNISNSADNAVGSSLTSLPFSDNATLVPFIGLINDPGGSVGISDTTNFVDGSDNHVNDRRRIMRLYYQKVSRKVNNKVGLVTAINTA